MRLLKLTALLLLVTSLLNGQKRRSNPIVSYMFTVDVADRVF